MIETRWETIEVIPDNLGEELCLRIQDTDSVTGILNLCWLDERNTERLIRELTKAKERLKERREKIDEIIRTKDLSKMYCEFEDRYNHYPVQMSRAEAFGKALAEGLIDEDTYQAAYKHYKRLWNYVGD